MKNYLYILLMAFFVLSCGDTEYNEDNYTDLIDSEYPPVMTFDNNEYNFGTIIEGAIVVHQFTFTNTGKGPLLISSVSKECGCTVPKSWSREIIKPGEKGFIDVEFNSEGFPGDIMKNLSVSANTKPASTVIKLNGKVIGPTK